MLKRIRDHILSEENLNRLIDLVNAEYEKRRMSADADRSAIRAEVEGRRRRLDRLFESLETGHLGFSDVAPRIKKVRDEIDELEKRFERVTTDSGKIGISRAHVTGAVDQLRRTLATGTATQRKQFIRSFVLKIVYDFPKFTIYYTFPVKPESLASGGGEPAKEVLSLAAGSKVLGTDKKGSPGMAQKDPGSCLA